MSKTFSAAACVAQGRRFRLSLINGGVLALVFGIPHLAVAAGNGTVSTSNVYANSAPPAAGERLSDWLLRQQPSDDAYLVGLSWLVPSEKPVQAAMQNALRAHLLGSEWTYRADSDARLRLSAWVDALSVTGRVPVEVADPRWLEAHPAQNPVLAPDHRVLVPNRPTTVTVVTSEGRFCKVKHTAGYQARAYVDVCKAPSLLARVDHVWIAQPDGRVEDFGIASWNQQSQGELAPGAWIWAPAVSGGWSDEFSRSLINFLATQGPAQDNTDTGSHSTLTPALGSKSLPTSVLARDPVITGNDWGGIGLLQTPTARMAKAGELSVSFSRAYPYSNVNVTLQPLDWMELSYRYSSVSGVAYGPTSLSGSQSYKDKSVDLKLRLHKETAFLPELAVGGRDIVGTGLFSGEYLVASKRTGNVDWSLGLGWGALGSAGTLGNPLSVISSKFNSRSSFVGEGGTARFGNYFRGRTAPFGGAQIQTPIDPLILKLEYEGNNYQAVAPQFAVRQPKSRFNLGAVYRYSPSIDLTLGLQRGNVATLGVALHFPLDRLATPKINDPAPPRFIAERPAVANWTSTANDLRAQTGWRVEDISQQGSMLQVEFANADAVYWRDMIERATAVLHRDAPSDVEEFRFIYKGRGALLADIGVNRDSWVKSKTQPPLPSEMSSIAQIVQVNQPATEIAPRTRIHRSELEPFSSDVGFRLKQSFGGPDGFVLYQVSIEGNTEWRLSENTWLSGSLNLRALDNYGKFRYTADSSLPRVRTFAREFLTTSRVTIPNLQLTHAGQLSTNQFVSVYGGYLESMYAGVGAEWLYRPFRGPLALGVDVNGVRQRNFDQKFGFRDYKAMTGHVTAYIETGWNDVIAKVSAGQYLARDRGVTLDLSRRFSNGVVFGAFATKTNVSAAQFGEGSFDKGIYFSIPFAALFTRSTPDVGSFVWNPLTRDGGAKLSRAFSLYDMTNIRDPRALAISPPANK